MRALNGDPSSCERPRAASCGANCSADLLAGCPVWANGTGNFPGNSACVAEEMESDQLLARDLCRPPSSANTIVRGRLRSTTSWSRASAISCSPRAYSVRPESAGRNMPCCNTHHPCARFRFDGPACGPIESEIALDGTGSRQRTASRTVWGALRKDFAEPDIR